jgi:phospholipid/cholesterol/gamma-HCH transport system permease protein
MSRIHVEDNRIFLIGELTFETVDSLYRQVKKTITSHPPESLVLDLQQVEHIDTAGVAFLDEAVEGSFGQSVAVTLDNIPPELETTLQAFSTRSLQPSPSEQRSGFFQHFGGYLIDLGLAIKVFFVLMADAFYYAVLSLFRPRGLRRGEFVNQAILIGMNAFPIVALISFLIGFILALQSAAQLRMFGADIYVADLIAISMTREMGPIMTAIIFAGRSGSAIASELATMKVTEEIDALESMAINPVQYVLVPKIYAITTMLPLLTVLSMIIGMLGALTIGVVYLDIGVQPFYNQVVKALILKDVLTGLIKSVVFAWIVVMTGAYTGLTVRGGSQDVGRATTASVVMSIFLVILADSLLGLLFYF